jgi:hypothetical protein
MNKTDQIREAYSNLTVNASNRQIAQETERIYGFKPTAQHIYNTLGSEAYRAAESFTAAQFLAVQETSRLFPNFKAYRDCVVMVHQLENKEKLGRKKVARDMTGR